MGLRLDYKRKEFEEFIRRLAGDEFSKATVTKVIHILQKNGVEYVWQWEETPMWKMINFDGIGDVGRDILVQCIRKYVRADEIVRKVPDVNYRSLPTRL